jgi:hypothetical protein
MTMNKLMPAVLLAAGLATPAIANPAVTAWPWDETVIEEPAFGRACHFADGHVDGTPKPAGSYVEFRCAMFDEYKKNAAFPVPTCGAYFPGYFCSLEDCISYASRLPQATRRGSYSAIVACATQTEPGATWQFDDSP